jgi:hypothetical protein
MLETIEALLMIAAISAGLIWYALVLARREAPGRTKGAKPAARSVAEKSDPDAHLGRTGTE